MKDKRRQRIASLLREEIAEILRRDVRDPRIGFLSVTRVEATDDLKEAIVFVSILGTEAEQRTTLRGVRAAARHIQTQLAPRLHFKNTPVLRFTQDQSIEKSIAMNALIEKAREEDEAAAQARTLRDQPPA